MDYPVTDPEFASLHISPGLGIPMTHVGWENAGLSAAFIINAKDLLDDIAGKQAQAMNFRVLLKALDLTSCIDVLM
jgi:hypothetical protein